MLESTRPFGGHHAGRRGENSRLAGPRVPTGRSCGDPRSRSRPSVPAGSLRCRRPSTPGPKGRPHRAQNSRPTPSPRTKVHRQKFLRRGPATAGFCGSRVTPILTTTHGSRKPPHRPKARRPEKPSKLAYGANGGTVHAVRGRPPKEAGMAAPPRVEGQAEQTKSRPPQPSRPACLRKTTPSIVASWAGSSGKLAKSRETRGVGSVTASARRRVSIRQWSHGSVDRTASTVSGGGASSPTVLKAEARKTYRSPRWAPAIAPALHHSSGRSPSRMKLLFRCRWRLWQKTRAGPCAATACRLAAIIASRRADSRNIRVGDESAIQEWYRSRPTAVRPYSAARSLSFALSPGS